MLQGLRAALTNHLAWPWGSALSLFRRRIHLGFWNPLHRHERRTEQPIVELRLPMFQLPLRLRIQERPSVELRPPTLHRRGHLQQPDRPSVELRSTTQDPRVGRPSGRAMENQGNDPSLRTSHSSLLTSVFATSSMASTSAPRASAGTMPT